MGILPTDTLYGVVGSALLPKTVARIYRVRKRNRMKPMIVLISDREELSRFGVSERMEKWPAKTSIVFRVRGEKFRYLHRGTHSIAFRVPRPTALRRFLRKSGPLVAASANPEGMPPATTIRQARKYFGASVDFYADIGPRRSKPSALVRFAGGRYTEVIRK